MELALEFEIEKFRGVDRQIHALFNLLSLKEDGISHLVMPSFEEHKYFCLNNPYKEWFLIKSSQEYLGNFYIQFDNSVGINIPSLNEKVLYECLQFIKNNCEPEKEVKSKVPPSFYINVSAKNEAMKLAMENLSLRPLQISYKL